MCIKIYKVDYTNKHFGISHILVSAYSKKEAAEKVHRQYNDYMIINLQEYDS